MPDIMSASIKVLIVEERYLLRERIADLLTGEKNIAKVMQVSSYSELQTDLEEMKPDLVLGDFFEFNKFCDETGILLRELYPDMNILLYSDEDGRLKRIKVGRLGEQRVFDVRRIQQEVRGFLKNRSKGNKQVVITK